MSALNRLESMPMPTSLSLVHARQRERQLTALRRELRDLEAAPLRYQTVRVEAGDPDFARVARAVRKLGLGTDVHSLSISKGGPEGYEIHINAGLWEKSTDLERWFQVWAATEDETT